MFINLHKDEFDNLESPKLIQTLVYSSVSKEPELYRGYASQCTGLLVLIFCVYSEMAMNFMTTLLTFDR